MYLRNKINYKNCAKLELDDEAQLIVDPQGGDCLKIKFKHLKKVFRKNPVSLDDSKPFLIRLKSDLESQDYYISHFNRNDQQYGNCFTIVKNDEWVVSLNRFPKEDKFCYVELRETEARKIESAYVKEYFNEWESV